MSCNEVVSTSGDGIPQGESNHPRFCELCNIEISKARLAAMPFTNRCTLCTELSGDVTPIKRYDEPGMDGEVHSTYYKKPNQYLEVVAKRDLGQSMATVIPSESIQ